MNGSLSEGVLPGILGTAGWLYTAVAEVLAYVYQLRNPEYTARRPIKPQHLPVPEDMDIPEPPEPPGATAGSGLMQSIAK